MREKILSVLALGLIVTSGCALGFSATLFYQAVTRPVLSQDSMYNSVRAQTFRILNPANTNSGGTGFSVQAPSGSVFTLTNAHVCTLNKNGALISEREGVIYRLQMIAVSEKTDLCLLQGVPGYEGLEVAESANIHEELYITGHPYLNPITLTHGFTHAVGTPVINYCSIFTGGFPQAYSGALEFMNSDCMLPIRAVYTNAAAAPGNSGSPATNKYGEVVGVLFAGSGTGESLIVPLEDVQEFLAGY